MGVRAPKSMAVIGASLVIDVASFFVGTARVGDGCKSGASRDDGNDDSLHDSSPNIEPKGGSLPTA